MSSIYLILAADVKEVFLRDPDPVLRYVCEALDLQVPPYSGPLYEVEEMDKRCFTTVEKLESRTWREYFETAMKCIEESEYVIYISTSVYPFTNKFDIEGAFTTASINSILEAYCTLIDIEVKDVIIPGAEWAIMVNNYSTNFVYNKPSYADAVHPEN